MTRNHFTFAGLLTAALLLVAPLAKAASLQQVNNWAGGVSGLPSDVTMFAYVPDKVSSNPPILVLIHYCGGTASAVFGQAQGGGIVKAADQYGFIMVVPSSGRCWDVQSNKAFTRDGGGDSHAIKQMVTYALATYGANPDRIYATGDSSGGMMTELLLGLYPDMFKAGAAFAGMPAGCRGATETGSGGGYSGACAGGSVTHTAQEWGDIARKLDPGYAGHHPRVQLFHGDADTTIRYQNFTEAIKEWTNVLGLSTSATSTDMGVQLGNHQATRQRWQNSCGYVVLDAFASIGGDHGPSDALFLSQYVIPFLGLDKTGSVDPEIGQCGDAGVGGTSGGTSGTTGVTGTTGVRDGGRATGTTGTDGGSGATTGATGGRDGGRATGGSTGATIGSSATSAGGGPTGGTSSNGGPGNTGAGTATGTSVTNTGSTSAATGSSGSSDGSGGGAASSDSSATGGASGLGTTVTGGNAATGAGTASSGASSIGGAVSTGSTAKAQEPFPTFCGCRVGKAPSTRRGPALALGLMLAAVARRRRRTTPRRAQ